MNLFKILGMQIQNEPQCSRWTVTVHRAPLSIDTKSLAEASVWAMRRTGTSKATAQKNQPGFEKTYVNLNKGISYQAECVVINEKNGLYFEWPVPTPAVAGKTVLVKESNDLTAHESRLGDGELFVDLNRQTMYRPNQTDFIVLSGKPLWYLNLAEQASDENAVKWLVPWKDDRIQTLSRQGTSPGGNTKLQSKTVLNNGRTTQTTTYELTNGKNRKWPSLGSRVDVVRKSATGIVTSTETYVCKSISRTPYKPVHLTVSNGIRVVDSRFPGYPSFNYKLTGQLLTEGQVKKFANEQQRGGVHASPPVAGFLLLGCGLVAMGIYLKVVSSRKRSSDS